MQKKFSHGVIRKAAYDPRSASQETCLKWVNWASFEYGMAGFIGSQGKRL